jgi:hypothetical protein
MNEFRTWRVHEMMAVSVYPCVVGTIYVSGVSPTVNPTFPNGVSQGQLVATARTSANNNNSNHNNNNNNTGAAVLSGTLPSDPNRLLLLESGEETGTLLALCVLHLKAVPFSVLNSSVQQSRSWLVYQRWPVWVAARTPVILGKLFVVFLIHCREIGEYLNYTMPSSSQTLPNSLFI